MPGRSSNSSRRIVGLFLALVLVPSALLVWLGWRLFEQDRANALRQFEERRGQTADLAISILEQAVASTESSLRDTAARNRVAAHGDAVAAVIDGSRLSLAEGGRLAYSPLPDPGKDVSAQPFAEADALKQRGDVAGARERYHRLSQSREVTVKAGALLRLSQLATSDARLDWLHRLSQLEGASLEDVPVGLLARVERCHQLDEMQRTPARQQEATVLREDLRNGRWWISKLVYEANLGDGCLNVPGALADRTAAETLATAIESWWQSDRLTPSGRRYQPATGVTIVWVNDGDTQRFVAGLPGFVEREWLTPIRTLEQRQRARIVTRDPAIRTATAGEERRSAADTDLPWSVVVSDMDGSAEMARLDQRRSLWLAGLAALLLLLGSGGYFVARAIGRELAVARLQSDFVAAVSHEFRTPLTSMRQLTEILVDERVTAPERQSAYFRALARQTDRLHRLVESLLDLGRLEAGTTPYRLEPLDACALVRSVVEEFERETAGNGVRIELDVDGTATQVAGDRDALTNALWNLLDNAVKYSPDCRTVWVNVERNAGRLLVRVRDQGIGIPDSERRAIFDKFVRGARAKTDGFKGTGIGLSMVRHIVAAHGGEVRVESAVGAGSTFTVALPITKFEVQSSKFEAAT